MSKDILVRVRELISRHKGFFVCWSGVIYGDQHRLVRLDKAFLNAVYLKEGQPYFRRIIGSLQKRADGERYLLYSLAPLYRITSGPRRGHVVTAAQLQSKDSYQLSGLYRELEYFKKTGFDPERAGDVDLLQTMKSLPDFVEVNGMTDTLPTIFLTCETSSRTVYLRHTPQAVEALRALPEYDGQLTTEEMFRRHGKRLGISLGHGRMGYPYELVHGKGVLAAMVVGEKRAFGFWQHVPSAAFACCLPHLETKE